MDVYEMARDLGLEILNTNETKRLLEAKKSYEADTNAVNMINEYNEIQQNYQIKLASGEISEDEKAEFIKILTEKADIIKANAVTNELIDSETAFNQFVNSIINVMTSTMAEGVDANAGAGGCGGGCSPSACSSCGGGCGSR